MQSPGTITREKKLYTATIKGRFIFDFTWTDNGESEEGTVDSYLKEYFPDLPEAKIYGGHRPVRDIYSLRAGGRYVQIHNPDRYAAVFLKTISDYNNNYGVHYIDNQNFRQRVDKMAKIPKTIGKIRN